MKILRRHARQIAWKKALDHDSRNQSFAILNIAPATELMAGIGCKPVNIHPSFLNNCNPTAWG
jgi:hypothetical protein